MKKDEIRVISIFPETSIVGGMDLAAEGSSDISVFWCKFGDNTVVKQCTNFEQIKHVREQFFEDQKGEQGYFVEEIK